MKAPRVLRVYVAGPYTKGDVAINVANAVRAANELFENGFYPYVPHLTHFWHFLMPRPYEDWLRLDMEWLRVCNALLRLPGESAGADKEVAEAKRLTLPVHSTVQEVVLWRNALDDNSY